MPSLSAAFQLGSGLGSGLGLGFRLQQLEHAVLVGRLGQLLAQPLLLDGQLLLDHRHRRRQARAELRQLLDGRLQAGRRDAVDAVAQLL